MLRVVAALIFVLPGAEASELPELSGNGCSCPSTHLFKNERLPVNDHGGGCVGGCGGDDFAIHKEGGIVRKLQVWYGTYDSDSEGIRAIRIAYFGDVEDHTIGTPGAEYAEITFSEGETIQGDVTLSGNGFGTIAGYIKFSTSKGQNFEVGNNWHTKYLFDSGDSFLAGIRGRSASWGHDGYKLNSLSFIFWKPVQSVVMTGISFPTLSSLGSVTSPKIIASQTYCNDNDEKRPSAGQTVKKTVTVGTDSCFTFSASETYGASVEVKAGVPQIGGDVTAKAHWELSASQELKNCETRSDTEERTITFPSPDMEPHTRMTYQFTQWEGSLSSLPFKASLEIRFSDHTSIALSETGLYKGISYSSVMQSWTNEERGVTKCAGIKNETVLV
jgi:hypothetical protein